MGVDWNKVFKCFNLTRFVTFVQELLQEKKLFKLQLGKTFLSQNNEIN